MSCNTPVIPLNPPCPIVDESPRNRNGILFDDQVISDEISQHRYSLLSTNIQSLSKNIHHLRDLVGELKPDFVSLVEIFKLQLKSDVHIEVKK